MKVLVPIKRVPDPYERIRVSDDGTLPLDSVKWVINPFDEIALEEAVRLRERGAEIELVTVSVGGSECEEQLRASLAMGADRAILVEADGPLGPSDVSEILAAICRRESAQLILIGKQAIDDDFGQTGQMLAAKLGVPQATFASSVTLEGESSAVVVREVDAGRETARVILPAVITADLRLNEPRYVALPAILRARSKPLERISMSELGVDIIGEIEVVELFSPPGRKAGRKMESVDELISARREEARAI